jgi:hypothetical protein
MHPVFYFTSKARKYFTNTLKNRNSFQNECSHSATKFTKQGTQIYEVFMSPHNWAFFLGEGYTEIFSTCVPHLTVIKIAKPFNYCNTLSWNYYPVCILHILRTYYMVSTYVTQTWQKSRPHLYQRFVTQLYCFEVFKTVNTSKNRNFAPRKRFSFPCITWVHVLVPFWTPLNTMAVTSPERCAAVCSHAATSTDWGPVARTHWPADQPDCFG